MNDFFVKTIYVIKAGPQDLSRPGYDEARVHKLHQIVCDISAKIPAYCVEITDVKMSKTCLRRTLSPVMLPVSCYQLVRRLYPTHRVSSGLFSTRYRDLAAFTAWFHQSFTTIFAGQTCSLTATETCGGSLTLTERHEPATLSLESILRRHATTVRTPVSRRI